MLALDNKWIWDFWLAREGADWHAFFLQAPKAIGDPELRHWNVSIGHATSPDLSGWTYRGTCFGPSDGPAWDNFTTWTGSVVRGDDDTWHLFYTGTCRQEDGKKQRIGHATAKVPGAWERVGDGLALDLDPVLYEEYTPGHWHDRAMRDPWVMRDPDGDGWVMYFTARVPGIPEANDGGAIGLARSADLHDWMIEPPVHTGGFGQLEVPQVVRVGERWVCLFCTAGEHWSRAYAASYGGPPVTGTHYLIADSHLGPWSVAPGRFFDADASGSRYAGRLVQDGNSLFEMAFLGNTPDGEFIGALSDPVPVTIGVDGLLTIERPDERDS